MSQEDEKNIIQRAKELLNTDADYGLMKIYNEVKTYRKNTHPDRFSDDKAKEEATKNFKKADKILSELRKKIEREKANKDSTELAIYEDIYDQFGTEVDLENAKNRIKELEEKNVSLEEQNKELKNEIERRADVDLEKDLESIESNYKPSKRNLISLGASFLLTSAGFTFSKIESISKPIFQYSPISEYTLNTILFLIFISILLLTFKKIIEHKIINRKVSEIISPVYVQKFLKYIEGKELNDTSFRNRTIKFYERHVYQFVSPSKTYLTNILGKLGFKLYQDETTELLKNIFIQNLLKKKLIKISKAKDLDRQFIVKKK